jgi:hypothetical protein
MLKVETAQREDGGLPGFKWQVLPKDGHFRAVVGLKKGAKIDLVRKIEGY